MFMYLLKTAKDFIYIQKNTNISTKILKNPKRTEPIKAQKCDSNEKQNATKSLFKRPNCQISDTK